MRARSLYESKWWEFDEPTITLYHGTSSVFTDTIYEEGLKPRDFDLTEHVEEILEDYKDVLPKDPHDLKRLRDYIQQTTIDYRQNRLNQDRRAALYFYAEPSRVALYAESYAQHGGEIAYEVWKAITHITGDKNLPIRWESAKPIIVKVDIPREWVKTHRDLKDIYNNVRKNWQGVGSLEEYLDDFATHFEIFINEPVPPHMIKDIKQI